MFHSGAFWLRTLGLNPLKPFPLPRGCGGKRVGVMPESRETGAEILEPTRLIEADRLRSATHSWPQAMRFGLTPTPGGVCASPAGSSHP